MDRVDEVLALPEEQFGEALGALLADHWRGMREEAARERRAQRMDDAEWRRLRKQRGFLSDVMADIVRARHHHDTRTPRQLQRVARALRRALVRAPLGEAQRA